MTIGGTRGDGRGEAGENSGTEPVPAGEGTAPAWDDCPACGKRGALVKHWISQTGCYEAHGEPPWKKIKRLEREQRRKRDDIPF